MINLARTRPAMLLIPDDLAANDEIVERRRWNGKTFELAEKGQFRATTIMGAAHYKDNYNDDKEIWKEIDLAFDASNLTASAPYSAQALSDRVGYTYISKRGGQIDVELLEVGSVPVNNARFRFRRVDNQVFWDDVADGVDMKLTLRPLGAEIFKQLADASAARTFLWRIQEDVVSQARLRRQTAGVDANGDVLEVLHVASPGTIVSENGRTYTRFDYSEEWTGRVSRRISEETRQKDWFDDPVYPVLIDVPANENIVADADDGFEYVTNTSWINNANSQWYWGWSGGPGTYHGGVRFQTLGVPNAATINTGTITIQVSTLLGVGGKQATIYGDDVDSAAAWSNASLPSGIAQTAASANFTPAATGTFTIGITGIVQEIINRPGWASGNIRFAFLNQNGTSYHFIGVYDYIQGQPNAARLTIDYTAGARQPRHGFVNFQIPGIV